MFFYILRLNIIPVDNTSTKRLYKIGITEDLPRRLEDHKTGLIGGYEIVNIIEHDYELMTIETNFKSNHLPYHGREIFLLEKEDLNFITVGSVITDTVIDKMRPGLCSACNKPAQSVMFHKCRKIKTTRTKVNAVTDVNRPTSTDVDLKVNRPTSADDLTKVDASTSTEDFIPGEPTDVIIMDRSSYLTFSQRALKLGIIDNHVYQMILEFTPSQ